MLVHELVDEIVHEIVHEIVPSYKESFAYQACFLSDKMNKTKKTSDSLDKLETVH